jgi:hypothetical protein
MKSFDCSVRSLRQCKQLASCLPALIIINQLDIIHQSAFAIFRSSSTERQFWLIRALWVRINIDRLSMDIIIWWHNCRILCLAHFHIKWAAFISRWLTFDDPIKCQHRFYWSQIYFLRNASVFISIELC